MDFEEAKPLINAVKSTEVGNATSRSRKTRFQEVETRLK